MKIVIGSDHAGFALKSAIGDAIRGLGHELLDIGVFNENPCDYPDIAELAARAVADGKSERGVLIDGSGVGIGHRREQNSRHSCRRLPRHLFRASRSGARQHERPGDRRAHRGLESGRRSR